MPSSQFAATGIPRPQEFAASAAGQGRTRPPTGCFSAQSTLSTHFRLVKTLSFIAESSRRSRRPNSLVAPDTLLVGVAVLIISLSFFPDQANRQLIFYRSPSGMAERYSLSVDDPRLPILHQQLQTWREYRPADRLGVTRWQKETAQLYAEQLAENDSPVAQVSFEMPTPVQPDAAPSDVGFGPGTQRYWLAVSEECEQVLRRQTEAFERHIRERGEPPVVFGEVVAPGASPRILGICATLGLLAAFAFSIWAKFAPHIELQRREDLEGVTDRDSTSDLRLTIPRHWIRIRQPASVRIRQGTYAMLVLWALCCVLR